MAQCIATALLFALIGASAAKDCAIPTVAQCDASILPCCDGNFRQALKIADSCGDYATYQKPECVREAVEKMYALGGTEGLLTVCSAFYSYQKCLGISYRSCTSDSWLIQHGFPVLDSQLFETIFAQFNFACGAGVDSFLIKDECMSSVFKNSVAIFAECRNEFVLEIERNPDEKCDSLDMAVRCMAKPFQDTCGMEAAWWGCEYERTGSEFFLPECSVSCAIAQAVNAPVMAAVQTKEGDEGEQ